MDTSRGAVPADFAIDACIDSSSVWLRNTLDVPIDLAVSGDTGTPVRIQTDVGPVNDLTRAKYPSPLLLLPGDIMRIPFGTGAATVTLADTDPGGFYALAQTVANFLPAGAIASALTAFTDLIAELNDDFAQYANCIADANFITRAKCRALLVRNVAFAVGRAAVKGLAKGLVSVLINEVTFAQWAANQPSQIGAILGSDRTIDIAAAATGLIFDSSPGTASPPTSLGPYTMTPFGADARDLGVSVSSFADPAGTISFDPELTHYRVAQGWLTWSHGYTGDVYADFADTTETITLPTGPKAFYFYAEPNRFDVFTIDAIAQDGTDSGPISVQGNSGAQYFGFYGTGSARVASIMISTTDTSGFAVGEFGIAK